MKIEKLRKLAEKKKIDKIIEVVESPDNHDPALVKEAILLLSKLKLKYLLSIADERSKYFPEIIKALAESNHVIIQMALMDKLLNYDKQSEHFKTIYNAIIEAGTSFAFPLFEKLYITEEDDKIKALTELLYKIGGTSIINNEIEKIKKELIVYYKPVQTSIGDPIELKKEMHYKINAIKLSKFKEAAVIPLIETLDTCNYMAKRFIFQALGIIGDKRAIPSLTNFLKNKIEGKLYKNDILYAAIGGGDKEAVDCLNSLKKLGISQDEQLGLIINKLKSENDIKQIIAVLDIMISIGFKNLNKFSEFKSVMKRLEESLRHTPKTKRLTKWDYDSGFSDDEGPEHIVPNPVYYRIERALDYLQENT